MKGAAYSSDGYIINQGIMDDVAFGGVTCKRSGCGLIAAYNLLKSQQRDGDWDKLLSFFQKGLIFGGRWGIMPGRISRFLKEQGFAFERTISPKRAAEIGEKSGSGILLYHSGDDLHYAAYYNCGGGVHRFLNAVYGNDRHLMTMEGFLAKHSRLPVVCLWYNKYSQSI